jgi:hypothetical protein
MEFQLGRRPGDIVYDGLDWSRHRYLWTWCIAADVGGYILPPHVAVVYRSVT